MYFGITIILSVLGWTGLPRTVRGKFLALREENFTQAAKYLGACEMRIIIRHMVPSFSSHLTAVLTLRVPEMIRAETSLSTKSRGKLTSEVCVSDAVLRWGLPRRQRNARLGLMFEVAHGRGRGESRRSQRRWETALMGTHGFPGGERLYGGAEMPQNRVIGAFQRLTREPVQRTMSGSLNLPLGLSNEPGPPQNAIGDRDLVEQATRSLKIHVY